MNANKMGTPNIDARAVVMFVYIRGKAQRITLFLLKSVPFRQNTQAALERG